MRISRNWVEFRQFFNDFVYVCCVRLEMPEEEIVTAKQIYAEPEKCRAFAAKVREHWNACPWMHEWASEKKDFQFLEEFFEAFHATFRG